MQSSRSRLSAEVFSEVVAAGGSLAATVSEWRGRATLVNALAAVVLAD